MSDITELPTVEPFTVEFAPTAQLTGMDTGQPGIRARIVARVYPLPKGRSRPVISLVGEDWQDAVKQVGLWMEAGRPTMDEAKAGAS